MAKLRITRPKILSDDVRFKLIDNLKTTIGHNLSAPIAIRKRTIDGQDCYQIYTTTSRGTIFDLTPRLCEIAVLDKAIDESDFATMIAFDHGKDELIGRIKRATGMENPDLRMIEPIFTNL